MIETICFCDVEILLGNVDDKYLYLWLPFYHYYYPTWRLMLLFYFTRFNVLQLVSNLVLPLCKLHSITYKQILILLPSRLSRTPNQFRWINQRPNILGDGITARMDSSSHYDMYGDMLWRPVFFNYTRTSYVWSIQCRKERKKENPIKNCEI